MSKTFCSPLAMRRKLFDHPFRDASKFFCPPPKLEKSNVSIIPYNTHKLFSQTLKIQVKSKNPPLCDTSKILCPPSWSVLNFSPPSSSHNFSTFPKEFKVMDGPKFFGPHIHDIIFHKFFGPAKKQKKSLRCGGCLKQWKSLTAIALRIIQEIHCIDIFLHICFE